MQNTANAISDLFAAANLTAGIFIDLNLGMNRTGVLPENAISLFEKIHSLPALHILGLHAYDGHIKDRDINIRTEECLRAFEPVSKIKTRIGKNRRASNNTDCRRFPNLFYSCRSRRQRMQSGHFYFLG